MKLLKANAKERKKYKQIQQAIELCGEVLDNKYSEHIAFNCKVYAFVDKDDVHEAIDEQALTPDQKAELKEYWTEDQIWNEYNHILEMESENYHEWIGGCSVTSKKYVDEIKAKYANDKGIKSLADLIYPDLRTILKNKRTAKTRAKAIDEFFAYSTKLGDALYHIQEDEVGQYGRSGGHMAIAKANTFESYQEDLEHVLEGYFVEYKDGIFLKAESNYFGYDKLTRQEWEDEVYDACDYDPQDVIDECKAILFILEESKQMVKGIDEKFILEEIKIRFEDFQTSQPSTLSIQDEVIVTSQQVKISLRDALEFGIQIMPYRGKEHTDPNLMVGNYKGFVSNENTFTVGCHIIEWSHAMDTLKTIRTINN